MKSWRRIAREAAHSKKIHAVRRRPWLESIEHRCLLAADALVVGVVYVEQDLGSDLHGDTFEITFAGGSPQTQLTRIVVDGDQVGDFGNAPGLSMGDVIFDTVHDLDTLGADEAFPFSAEPILRADGSPRADARVRALVDDGGTLLVLELTNFFAGDRLRFSIDVDEVQEFDPRVIDWDQINEGLDPLTSGAEFQGALLQAEFNAPGFFAAVVDASFINRYDDAFAKAEADAGASLDLPLDDADGLRDRTAGAAMVARQQPMPIGISGSVFHDHNLDLVRQSTEEPIAGAMLTLWRLGEAGYVSVSDAQGSPLQTRTDAQGRYAFEPSLGLPPATYQVRQVQPDGFPISVGAIVGRIAGAPVGQATDTNTLSAIDFPLGGQTGVNYDFAEARPASLSGRVFHDRNDNGRVESDEVGIGGVRVEIHDSQGAVRSTLTDDQGRYLFDDLDPGDYVVREVQPEQWFDGKDAVGVVETVLGAAAAGGIAVEPDEFRDIHLTSAARASHYDFGEQLATIGGFVYHDRDNDGIRREPQGETGIAGVLLTLMDADGQPVRNAQGQVRTVQTDASGAYRFAEIPPGVYGVAETQPADWLDGRESVGSIDGRVVGDATVNDHLRGIDLQAVGQSRNAPAAIDYNFGERLPASISGRVHSDLNQDCIVGPGESVLAGVVVELRDSSGAVVQRTTTDTAGRYQFMRVPPGQYTVGEIQPADYFDAGQRAGSGGGNASQPNQISQIFAQSDTALHDYDFCEVPPATLSGFVFVDEPPVTTSGGVLPNDRRSIQDGQRTPDDTPLAGVVIELLDSETGQPVTAEDALPGMYPAGPLRAVTDENGSYRFPGLPGHRSYLVVERQPTGVLDGLDTPGSTGGVALNHEERAEADQKLSLTPEQIESLLDDAIAAIPIKPAQVSQENNFSEVRVKISNPFPTPLTPVPVRIVPPADEMTETATPWVGEPLIPTLRPQDNYWPAGNLPEFTWHLSVIDAGRPRGVATTLSLIGDRRGDGRNQGPGSWSSQWMREGLWLTLQRINIQNTGVFSEQEARRQWLALYGRPGAIPVCGDFDGDGDSEIGVFLEGQWFLDLNGNGQWDSGDLWARLGDEGDLPVTGDWDGDGKDDIGVFGPMWLGDTRALKNEPGLPDMENRRDPRPKNLPPTAGWATIGGRVMQHTAAGVPRADLIDHVFRFGSGEHTPVAGDWNGDGITTVGVFRDGQWTLDRDGDGVRSPLDERFEFGEAGDHPVVGDFDGDGVDEIGVFRGGDWWIDANHNRQLDAEDLHFRLGRAGDLPVTGDFDGDGKDQGAVYREPDGEQLDLELEKDPPAPPQERAA